MFLLGLRALVQYRDHTVAGGEYSQLKDAGDVKSVQPLSFELYHFYCSNKFLWLVRCSCSELEPA